MTESAFPLALLEQKFAVYATCPHIAAARRMPLPSVVKELLPRSRRGIDSVWSRNQPETKKPASSAGLFRPSLAQFAKSTELLEARFTLSRAVNQPHLVHLG